MPGKSPRIACHDPLAVASLQLLVSGVITGVPPIEKLAATMVTRGMTARAKPNVAK
jgi:hypothetical protein